MHTSTTCLLMPPLLLLLLLLPAVQPAPLFDYETNDPSKWPTMFKKWCGGRTQSPIKLEIGASTYDTDMPAYTITEDSLTGVKYMAFNDGHKISIAFAPTAPNVSVPGHPGSCFRPHSIHWHWGASDAQGAEHWIEGKQFPLEGHVVMWNCQFYSSFSDALDGFGGLAVLGTAYEVDSSVTSYGSGLANLVSMLATEPRLQQCADCKNESFVPPMVPMNAFPIVDLLPSDRSQYYLYSGSLTTPDCRENVMWTVYRQSVKIPPSVLATLRSLKYPDGSAMVSNFRPPVPLNPADPFGARRVVVRSFNTGGSVLLPSAASWLRANSWNSWALSLAAVIALSLGADR